LNELIANRMLMVSIESLCDDQDTFALERSLFGCSPAYFSLSNTRFMASS
jgi:hypothetical protein